MEKSHTSKFLTEAMPRPTKTYDQRCYHLATLFLSDSPTIDNEGTRERLAAHLQYEIETWITYEERNPGKS